MNLWRRFQQLANPPSLVTVGTVVAAEFGYCTVEFPGGSQQRVQGAGEVANATVASNFTADYAAAALAEAKAEGADAAALARGLWGQTPRA